MGTVGIEAEMEILRWKLRIMGELIVTGSLPDRAAATVNQAIAAMDGDDQYEVAQRNREAYAIAKEREHDCGACERVARLLEGRTA